MLRLVCEMELYLVYEDEAGMYEIWISKESCHVPSELAQSN